MEVKKEIANNMPDSKKRLIKQVCYVCNTEIESEAYMPYMDRETICSGECYFKAMEAERRRKYNIEIQGIPIKYRTIEADKKLIASHYGSSLFITGGSGVGKTVLAASIAKECIDKKVAFKWIGCAQFIMELQAMYSKDNESPFDEAQRIANFNGVLIIDDIGAEKMSDWVRQILYYIINEREQRLLPTVITSNFSLQQIAEQIDIRISSRIAGMCKLIKLTGMDRRIEDKDKRWVNGEPRKLETKPKWKIP